MLRANELAPERASEWSASLEEGGVIILTINQHVFRFDDLKHFATCVSSVVDYARAFLAKQTGKRITEGESVN